MATEALAAAQDEAAIIAPRLHHVFLKTTRYREMRDWYATVAGFRPTFEFPDSSAAFMTNDDANHRLVLFSSPGITENETKRNQVGLHHIAFEYDCLGDLVKSYKRLKAADVLPHACLNHGPCISFYYADPDDNSVEMQADNFGDWEKSTAFMAAPEFLADPIGKSIDPDPFVDAFEDGALPEELNRRSYAGEFSSGGFDLRLPM